MPRISFMRNLFISTFLSLLYVMEKIIHGYSGKNKLL